MFLDSCIHEFSLLTHLWRRFASQSSGVLVINNYQILLYNNLGLYGWLPLLLYTIFSAWGALSNWVNSLILDRLGRVPVLTYGLVGCISVMAVETALVASYASTSNKGGNAAAVVFLFLFIMFYGGTQDASGYVYCSEIFPTPVRAQGLGICIAGLFATALVYTQVYPTASANIGWKYVAKTKKNSLQKTAKPHSPESLTEYQVLPRLHPGPRRMRTIRPASPGDQRSVTRGNCSKVWRCGGRGYSTSYPRAQRRGQPTSPGSWTRDQIGGKIETS